MQIPLAATNTTAFAGYFSEISACWVKVDAASTAATEVRMVDEIKRFGAELESHPFVDWETLKEAQVPVLEAWLVNEISNALMDEGASCGLNEDRAAIGILGREPLVGVGRTVGCKLSQYFRIAVNEPVLAVDAAPEIGIEANASVIAIARDAARQASLKLRDATDLPASQ